MVNTTQFNLYQKPLDLVNIPFDSSGTSLISTTVETAILEVHGITENNGTLINANASNISSNTAAIASNTGDLATQASNITNNIANITANTNAISVNTASITNNNNQIAINLATNTAQSILIATNQTELTDRGGIAKFTVTTLPTTNLNQDTPQTVIFQTTVVNQLASYVSYNSNTGVFTVLKPCTLGITAHIQFVATANSRQQVKIFIQATGTTPPTSRSTYIRGNEAHERDTSFTYMNKQFVTNDTITIRAQKATPGAPLGVVLLDEVPTVDFILIKGS